jgi:hypothetical protein
MQKGPNFDYDLSAAIIVMIDLGEIVDHHCLNFPFIIKVIENKRTVRCLAKTVESSCIDCTHREGLIHNVSKRT